MHCPYSTEGYEISLFAYSEVSNKRAVNLTFFERTKYMHALLPPVDLHWFFEISILKKKKIQLQLKKKIQL